MSAHILWMNISQDKAHAESRHISRHRNCLGFCAWGYSNNKHGPQGQGGIGHAARRIKRIARTAAAH